jgi:hypothetical protein
VHCQETILTIKELFSTHFGVYKKNDEGWKKWGEKVDLVKMNERMNEYTFCSQLLRANNPSCLLYFVRPSPDLINLYRLILQTQQIWIIRG